MDSESHKTNEIKYASTLCFSLFFPLHSGKNTLTNGLIKPNPEPCVLTDRQIQFIENRREKVHNDMINRRMGYRMVNTTTCI